MRKFCPVCGKGDYAWLRCYYPGCTDGRGLIEVSPKTDEIIEELIIKYETLLKRLADK